MPPERNKIDVSAIVPFFNSAEYLAESLESLLNQSIQTWECILVDDGSTDQSSKIAREYCKNDARFRYIFQENRGPSAARNSGVDIAQGEYVQFLDSDDILRKDRFELLLSEYKSTEKEVVLYSNMLIGDSENIQCTRKPKRSSHIGHDVGYRDMYQKFLIDFIFIPSCLLIPKRIIEKIKWDPSLKHSEDWDYYLNILSNDVKFRCVDIPLVIYRDTPKSLSKNLTISFESKYNILVKWLKWKDYFHFLYRTNQLFTNNLFLLFIGRTNKIFWPWFQFKNTRLNIIPGLFISLLLSVPIQVGLIAYITTNKLLFNRPITL